MWWSGFAKIYFFEELLQLITIYYIYLYIWQESDQCLGYHWFKHKNIIALHLKKCVSYRYSRTVYVQDGLTFEITHTQCAQVWYGKLKPPVNNQWAFSSKQTFCVMWKRNFPCSDVHALRTWKGSVSKDNTNPTNNYFVCVCVCVCVFV